MLIWPEQIWWNNLSYIFSLHVICFVIVKFMACCYPFCLSYVFYIHYGLTTTERNSYPSEVHLFWSHESCMSHSLMNHFRRAQNERSTADSAFQKYFIRNIRPTIYFSSAYCRRCRVRPSPVTITKQMKGVDYFAAVVWIRIIQKIFAVL
jgi:hypothetical protein